MAYEGWIEFNGSEFINVARTARVARSIGLDTVRIRSELVDTLESRFLGNGGFGLGGFGLTPFGGLPPGGVAGIYADITKTPWYDAGYPASAEFAGIVPLSFQGLDDSTLSSSPVEYITDGGHSGKPRNTTLGIVASVALVATTERGAEFGKRWMNRVLRESDPRFFCSGADLTYLRYAANDSPIVHRRDVRLTRGAVITRKKVSSCSSTWLATFTLTAGDPYEYGTPIEQVTSMGGGTAFGAGVASQGSLDLEEESCPAYDYSPIYDPTFPALIPAPTPPNFLPDGWNLDLGTPFRRKWVRLNPFEPVALNVVPMVILSSSVDARMVRFSIWAANADEEERCEPLFTVISTYIPANLPFYIDGEQKASYAWDGFSPAVRRTDSLIYGTDASPVQWASLSDPDGGLLITLDMFATDGGFEGDGTVRANVQFIPKSD